MSDKAGWAVLGAGGISSDFLRALPAAQLGTLRAVGARDAGRARAFADEFPADFAGAAAGTYDEVLALTTSMLCTSARCTRRIAS